MSLIECGPVNTEFLRNLKKTEVGDESVEVDAHTRRLYELYLQHCEKMFQNAAQDTDDIIQVRSGDTVQVETIIHHDADTSEKLCYNCVITGL